MTRELITQQQLGHPVSQTQSRGQFLNVNLLLPAIFALINHNLFLESDFDRERSCYAASELILDGLFER